MRTSRLAVLCIVLGALGLSLSAAAADDAGVVEDGCDAACQQARTSLARAAAETAARPDCMPGPVGDPCRSSPAPKTSPTPPDPLAAPVESISFVVKLWKTGTMPAAIIVGLFLLLTALSRKVKWLQSGYAAVVTAALLGAGAMLVERASAGTTPTFAMFTSAFVTAVALALKPKQPMGPPEPKTEPAK